MQKRVFQNELGNEIEVQVVEKGIDGVPGVELSIAGPTSTTTNHITKAEAAVLYEALGHLLQS